jgi:hypothetical protein
MREELLRKYRENNDELIIKFNKMKDKLEEEFSDLFYQYADFQDNFDNKENDSELIIILRRKTRTIKFKEILKEKKDLADGIS